MKKNNFLEGALIATFAIFFTKVLGVLYVIPFYKMIGTQGGALYGYAYTIYNLFLIISSAGIPLAISKLTSEYIALKKEKEKKYMYDMAQRAILIFSLLSFLICFIFAPQLATLILGDIQGGNTLEDVTIVLRCVSFSLLVVPSLSITRGYLQGHKYISASSLSQLIEQLTRIIIILLGTFLTLKVFKLSITVAVGVAVSGATIGALITYIYLTHKKKKIKSDLTDEELDKNTKKDIIKRILMYSIPFIIISIANHLYNTTDMILLMRGLNIIGYSGPDIENISSIFTTWGSKLTSIVTSISTGLVISLIPAIVSSYTLNDMKDVNKNFNKALQILLFIVLPIAIFASIFSKQIWTLFYSTNEFGPIIMKYAFIVAFIDGTFTVMCSTLNSLNKFKVIYLIVLIGLGFNAILDIPLILLFNKIGIYPYYGALTATVIGYTASIFITLKYLNKKFKFDYKPTFKLIPRLIISLLILIVLGVTYECLITNITNKVIIVLLVALFGIVALLIYYLLNKNILNSIIKIKFLEKIKNKFKKNKSLH